jgi:hypothetical protein
MYRRAARMQCVEVGDAVAPERYRLTVDHEFFSIDSPAPNPRIAAGPAASRGTFASSSASKKTHHPLNVALQNGVFKKHLIRELHPILHLYEALRPPGTADAQTIRD